MFWGTDITKMPCSWRQCATMFTEELTWLSDQDKRLIMGDALCAWWAGTGPPDPHHRPNATNKRKLPMSENQNTKGKQVAVVVGATSKWQSDGRNTKLAHGKTLDDSDLPVGVRWGVGGAVAQNSHKRGFFVVRQPAREPNASALEQAIRAQNGDCMIVELDLVSQDSFRQRSPRSAASRRSDVLIYNAGYLEGRDLPPEKELLEHIPVEMFDTAQHIASRGPFLVAKEVLPSMRKKSKGSFYSLTTQVRCVGRSE